MCKNIIISYYHGNPPNYGDELGPYIVKKLTNEHVIEKNLWIPIVNIAKLLIYSILKKRNFFLRTLAPFKKNILTIGSILSQSNYWSIVWGSGFMSDNESYGARLKNIKAVRGRKTLEKIQKKYPSFSCCLGDPGLLLPLVLPQKWTRNKDVVIVPHFKEYYFFLKYEKYFDIVDLTCGNIEQITKEITSHKYVLSTSLHGLIIAHAYGIPAIWMEYSGLEKGTNGFKFYDYLSSVGLDGYKPIKNIEEFLISKENVIEFFKHNSFFTLPKRNINEMQKELLATAPFEVKNSYKEI